MAATHDEAARAEIPEALRWNLDDLYPNAKAWRDEYESLAAALPELRQFRTTLVQSAETLADALDLHARLQQRLSRLSAYASLRATEDLRIAAHRAMAQQAARLCAGLGKEAAFIEPLLVQSGAAVISRFVAAEPRLAVYRRYLDDVARRAAHILPEREEALLAAAGPLAGAIFGVSHTLSQLDLPYPTITLHDGRDVCVDQVGYLRLRDARRRDDRACAMSAYFGALGRFSRTFGAVMRANVERATFIANARGYRSTLELALDAQHIPVSVYTRLVEGVRRHLPALHRALALRQRLLDLDELHYHDLYVPIVEAGATRYTLDEAQEHLLAAVAPLGQAYTRLLRRVLSARWIDYLPNAGKPSGAFSNGSVYDAHPYASLNYLGAFADASTLAHETGHMMHSLWANTHQPYPLAAYDMGVAEVASTFHEAMLIRHLLRTRARDAAWASLQGSHLDQIRVVVFRQTLFAEFQLRVHEIASAGEAITGEALAALYLRLVRDYYGHDSGVCIVADHVGHEWSDIPHLYGNFSVFQYATAFIASASLAEAVLAGGEAAQQRYLALLAAGGSDDPLKLLADAGADLSTDAPLDATMRHMHARIDELAQERRAHAAG